MNLHVSDSNPYNLISNAFAIIHLNLNWDSGAAESHLRRRDARHRSMNRRYELYRSAYLERIEEVVEAPGNNDVVIKRNEKCDYTRRDSYTA